MCDFNKLSDEQKLQYHEQLLKSAEAFGGINFFLQLLEGVRKNKSHPLSAKTSTFNVDHGGIKWNKVIFQDKLTLLLKVRVNESEQGNLYPPEGSSAYKKVNNLIRTLSPIEFKVEPKYRKDGEGFTFKAFDKIDEKVTLLNPLFDAIFFCSLETVKKVLNYKAR